jgi:hypothetical protein
MVENGVEMAYNVEMAVIIVPLNVDNVSGIWLSRESDFGHVRSNLQHNLLFGAIEARCFGGKQVRHVEARCFEDSNLLSILWEGGIGI